MAIPTSVDTIGKNVSWRHSVGAQRLYGEIVGVKYRCGPDPRYPKGSRGYKNGIRKLYKVLSIMLADGRVLKVSGEHEDLKKMGMVPEE